MNLLNISHNRILRFNVIAIFISIFACQLLPSLAKDKKPDFSRTDQPPKSKPAGSRGDCADSNKPLTIIAPASSGNIGLTTKERPTFWAYLPYVNLPENALKFELRNEQGKNIYKKEFSRGQVSPGTISINLPQEVPALEVGKLYRWHLSVYCKQKPSIPDVVSGWVKRVELDPKITQQIEKASPLERSKIYAQNTIWYDAVTVLAEELRTNPKNQEFLARWTELLELPSVGLNQFVSEPITPCCSLQNLLR
ncbi:MAG: DUF928 domain-containing protein [Scytonematopsis contorta HA4267-MV1]|jgi:hypothetical protein|nr:DUF928 domain-containing protein [Scytonematopsis contorta HA4267-MV1]